jgi:hypothetical protein
MVQTGRKQQSENEKEMAEDQFKQLSVLSNGLSCVVELSRHKKLEDGVDMYSTKGTDCTEMIK